MTAREVAELLTRIGAVEVRPRPDDWFTWASGARAPVYCDNRRLIFFPEERARIADALVASIREGWPDAEVIAGTATAGIPHAAFVAERLGLPMVYVRGSAKDHGRGRRVEGGPLQGERVVLVEDLISFGGSALAAVEALGAEGGKVMGVQAIFSYGFPSAVQAFEEARLRWRALSDWDALLETLDLSEQESRALREWRAR
jgi:orotate phosphoribosyltransferase